MSQQGSDNQQGPISMRLGDLRKLIADTVSSMTGSQPQQSQPRQSLRDQVRDSRSGQSRNVDDEVSAALAKIEADKKRQERDAAIDKDLTDLKERTKEKAPVERSRRHRFMGWGE